MLQQITSKLRTTIESCFDRGIRDEYSIEALKAEVDRESKVLRNLHSTDSQRLRSIEKLERVLDKASKNDFSELSRLCAQAVLQPLSSSEDEFVIRKSARLIMMDADNTEAQDFLQRVIEITSNNQKRSWLLNL